MPVPDDLKELLNKAPVKDALNTVPLIEWDLPGSVVLARAMVASAALPTTNRNNAAYRLAARVKDRGISRELATELLSDQWNARLGESGLDEEELEDAIANAYRYGRHAPGVARTGGVRRRL